MLLPLNLLQDHVSHVVRELITKNPTLSLTASFPKANPVGELVMEVPLCVKSDG